MSNDGSQSVKRRRRTLSTRCLVQFTHAGGDGGGDLPHHPYFFSRAAAKKLFLLDYQVRVVAIELHSTTYITTLQCRVSKYSAYCTVSNKCFAPCSLQARGVKGTQPPAACR